MVTCVFTQSLMLDSLEQCPAVPFWMTDKLLPACLQLCHIDDSVPVHPAVSLPMHGFAYGSSIQHNHAAKYLASRLLMVLHVRLNRQQLRLLWQKVLCSHLDSSTKNMK